MWPWCYTAFLVFLQLSFVWIYWESITYTSTCKYLRYRCTKLLESNIYHIEWDIEKIYFSAETKSSHVTMTISKTVVNKPLKSDDKGCKQKWQNIRLGRAGFAGPGTSGRGILTGRALAQEQGNLTNLTEPTKFAPNHSSIHPQKETHHPSFP